MSHVHHNDVIFPGVGDGAAVVVEKLVGRELYVQGFIKRRRKE